MLMLINIDIMVMILLSLLPSSEIDKVFIQTSFLLVQWMRVLFPSVFFQEDNKITLLAATIVRHTVAGNHLKTGWDKIIESSFNNFSKKKDAEQKERLRLCCYILRSLSVVNSNKFGLIFKKWLLNIDE